MGALVLLEMLLHALSSPTAPESVTPSSLQQNPTGRSPFLGKPQSSPHSSFLIFQQNDAKLDEILKELKSIKDTISNQDERISKLEQQMAKIAD